MIILIKITMECITYNGENVQITEYFKILYKHLNLYNSFYFHMDTYFKYNYVIKDLKSKCFTETGECISFKVYYKNYADWNLRYGMALYKMLCKSL